jgi:hypothetical protein
MAYELSDFAEIVEAVRTAIGIQESDTDNIEKIKRYVNMAYLHEVVPAHRWRWLAGHTAVVHKAKHNVGTASVTPDSASVTLSSAVNVALGSYKGYKFSVDGNSEIYEISAHTAGSASLTLDSTYQGTLNSAAVYKIWRDRVDLPADCEETIEVYHYLSSGPMKGIGLQEMRRYQAMSGKTEGDPQYYYTTDYYDPTTSDDETESDRYRQLLIFPACNTKNVTIQVDYKKEVSALNDDDDEPLMPTSDRIVLYYGGLKHAWRNIVRNPEEAASNEELFRVKLKAMTGDDKEDSSDKPVIEPKSEYLASIRKGPLGRRRRVAIPSSGGGSQNVTYLKDVVIEGATITDDVDVDAGVLIDGRDISVDGALLDSLANQTSAELVDNTSSATAIATWNFSTTADVVYLNYSIKRGTAREAGRLTIVTDGSSAQLAQGPVANINSAGVTFTVDVSGSTVRLLYTTTSTGSNAQLKYQSFKWLM